MQIRRLLTGSPAIDKCATGANTITLNGNNATRILNVGSGVNLAADNLNFTRGSNNGSGATGGAISNSGTLSLTNSALYNNAASNGGAIATVSSSVTNLTNFTNYRLQVFAPTAATVFVSGKVFVNDRGLRNAIVTMTDQTGATRATRTTSFGYYHFADVEAGQTYTISVQSKRFQFTPQVISVLENLSDLDFYSSGDQ